MSAMDDLRDGYRKEIYAKTQPAVDHVEMLYPLSEAARRSRVIRFVFLTDVGTDGYARVEYNGEQRMLYVGYGVLARKLMQWWTAGNEIKGTVCEVSWVSNRLDVWVRKARPDEVRGGQTGDAEGSAAAD